MFPSGVHHYNPVQKPIVRLPALSPAATAARATATTAAAGTSAAATRTSTFRFRTGFVHVQAATIKVDSIQGGDSAIAFRVVTHLYKSKSTRLARITIGHNAYAVYSAMGFEQRSNRLFG